jgi:hypothetical protein
MATSFVFIVLMAFAFLVCGALQESRDHLQELQAYVLQRYGEDLSGDDMDERLGAPTWIRLVNHWIHPSRLLARLRMVAMAIGRATCEAFLALDGIPLGFLELREAGIMSNGVAAKVKSLCGLAAMASLMTAEQGTMTAGAEMLAFRG